MRIRTRFSCALLLSGALFLMMAAPSYGQIQVDVNGKVSVGASAPLPYTQLYVVSSGSTNSFDYGFYAAATTTGKSTTIGSIGIAANATSANYGNLSYAVGAATTNYGVFGLALSATTNYAGYFSGDLAYTGSLIAISDLNFKENVRPLTGALARLMQLRPRSYTFKRTAAVETMQLPEGTRFGLIAQEVEAVLPELIHDNVHPGALDEDGLPVGEPISYKGVNYMELVPMLVQALQEQQAQIESLKAALRANGIDVN